MSYKIVWKLCKRQNNGKLVSAVAYQDPEIMATYPIGESVKPKVGFLFAFSTKEYAEQGRAYVGMDTVMVRCRAKVSKRQVPKLIVCLNRYLEFWHYFLHKKVFSTDYLRTMPPGTVFCSEVIPIEVLTI